MKNKFQLRQIANRITGSISVVTLKSTVSVPQMVAYHQLSFEGPLVCDLRTQMLKPPWAAL